MANNQAEVQALMQMNERIKINETLQMLTGRCWDLCMGYPSSKLDSRTENCVKNCVQRFLDSSNYVVNKLEKDGQKILAEEQKQSAFE